MSSEIDDNEGAMGPEYPVTQNGSSANLERRAIAERWPMSDQQRREAIDRQISIATDPVSPNRDTTRSFTALLKADALNQPSEVNVNMSGGVTVSQVVAQVIQDATAVEAIRKEQLGVDDADLQGE